MRVVELNIGKTQLPPTGALTGKTGLEASA